MQDIRLRHTEVFCHYPYYLLDPEKNPQGGIIVMEKCKLAVCTTHPIQYQAPVWRELASNWDIDLKVFFASDFSVRGYHDKGFGSTFTWDQPLLDGYDHAILGHGPKRGFFSMTGKCLRRPLEEFQPDVGLVCGYVPKYFPDAVALLKKQAAAVMMRAELTDADRDRNKIKQQARDLVVGWLYNKIDHFVSIGVHCRRHLTRMGIAHERISFGGYNIDNELFEKQYASFAGKEDKIREEMGIAPDEFVFLACGKLIPKKDPLLLVRAFRAMLESMPDLRSSLIFLGDGELKEPIMAEAGPLAGNAVRVTGFINQSELGKYYTVADSAVLPSAFGETWGLVVNEAQIFGLPAIVSDRVGCHPDLITPETGRVFPAGSQQALSSAMKEVIPWVRERSDSIATAARKRSAEYTAQKAAEAIARAAIQLAEKKNG